MCQMCRVLEVIIRNYKNVQRSEPDPYNRRSLVEEIESDERASYEGEAGGEPMHYLSADDEQGI